MNELTLYRVRFKTGAGWQTWGRWGSDMESTLATTKQAIRKDYGDEWTGGIIIERETA